MSAEARHLLQHIRTLFEQSAGSKQRDWYFDAGLTSAAHEELVALGALHKVLGTVRGFAWALTDAGRQQMLAPDSTP